MSRRARLVLLAAVLLTFGWVYLREAPGLRTQAPPADLEVAFELVASGLDQPVFVGHAGDGSGRVFVVEQPGVIRIIDSDGSLWAEPFLDIRDRVSCCAERGLLGLAFAPDYAETGHFFVNYTDRDRNTIVARFRRTPGSDERADATTEERVLRIEQPFSNHNGGHLAFGPDGMLYVATGDGGGAADPVRAGQDLSTLLAKILRIDVRSLPYSIPPDNPFVDRPGARGETWAWGLRNPWRFSFDRETGDLFLGDVGQNAWEEIDRIPAGKGGLNFGWPVLEGDHCFQPPMGCDRRGFTPPIAEYPHGLGCSVTGGHVYRGGAIPELGGSYLYADFCEGTLWIAKPDPDRASWSSRQLASTGFAISSFGEDAAGEILVCDLRGGAVHRIVPRRGKS